MSKKLSLKKVLLLCFVVVFLFSIFFIGRSFAANKIFKLVDAKIEEKSETVVSKVALDGDNVKTDLTFHKLDDYIVYKFSFKNTDNVDYIIKSIADDNSNAYIIYTYEQHKDERVKAGETKEILVKVTYNNEVKEASERDIKETVTFSFEIEDESGNKVIDNISINPKTNDNIVSYIALGIISFSGIVIIIIRNKKVKRTMFALILLTPFITKALNVSFSVTFINDVKLRDKELVTIDVNGNKTESLIPYNTKLEKPEDPLKDGYEFIGWFNGDKEYDFTKPVKDDLDIKAKYNLLEYEITYDYAGGISVNPIKYTVETDSFTLHNPFKAGYSFSGWTGSNGDTLQTRVTVEKGTTGNLTFKANFSVNNDTSYKVIHKYKNLDGDGYSEEVTEDLVGTTDSTVRPAALTKTGFENPELQDLIITGDGQAILEYVYERKMFNLSYSDDVVASKPEGSYKYGTPVTISASEKSGYTFNKWNVNTNGAVRFSDVDDNDLVTPGDIVYIGDDIFYVISEPSSGEVKILPKYNLNNSSRQSTSFKGVSFAQSDYWVNSSDFSPYLNSSYNYLYRTTNNRNNNSGDTDNNLKDYINTYKDYLDSLGITTIIDARLMSYEEAEQLGCSNDIDSCPSYISNQDYWLGSEYSDEDFMCHDNYSCVWMISNSHRYGRFLSGACNGTGCSTGIRPVIIISESEINASKNTNSQSTVIIEKDMNIVPSYNPNVNTPYRVIHKVQDVDDKTLYVDDIENKTGITGDTIRPEVRTTYGDDYTVPNVETTTINGDGTTEIVYVYDYKYYGVTYNPNDGTSTIESTRVLKGNSLTPPIPNYSGHTFIGWYDAAEGGNLIVAPGESYTPTNPIVLYAHYEQAYTQLSLIDEDNDLAISLGDRVTVGNEEFYFVGIDYSKNFKFMAKYNLDNNYRQSEDNFDTQQFSSTNYWFISSPTSSSMNASNFPSYNEYVYRTDTRTLNEDVPENNLKNHINGYKSHLQYDLGLNLYDVRLISTEDAFDAGCYLTTNTCASFLTNQSYWFGNAIFDDSGEIYTMNSSTHKYGTSRYDNYNGIRPVIYISESNISVPWEDNDSIIYSDVDGNHAISIGDSVRIARDGFKVVGVSNGEVKLLAMLNLNSDSRQSLSPKTTNYSSSKYWTSGSYSPLGGGSYNYIYRTSTNQNNTNGDTNNSLKTNINAYKDYLTSLNIINISDVRLLSYGEATAAGCSTTGASLCTSVFNYQTRSNDNSYWLGSDRNYNNNVWYIDYGKHLTSQRYNYVSGIRPLVVVSQSELNSFIN